MKFVILAAVAAVALAAPQYNVPEPPQPLPYGSNGASTRTLTFEQVPILRDDRIMEDDGRYNYDVETGNGITFSQSGSPDGPNGAVVKAGRYSYTAPDGTYVELKYVADENGYQPESDLLPVAPEFPHPIPQFVLDQIARAAEEDAAAARGEASEFRQVSPVPAPYTYSGPQ